MKSEQWGDEDVITPVSQGDHTKHRTAPSLVYSRRLSRAAPVSWSPGSALASSDAVCLLALSS